MSSETPTAKPEVSMKAPPPPSPSSPWDMIEIGRIVLWRSDPKEGWFECEVVGISKDKKTLTLKWRDYPTFKPFDVRRLAVGLICIVK